MGSAVKSVGSGLQSFLGGSLGTSTTGAVNPYKEFTAQQINSSNLQQNINQQASQQKEQNITGFNSAINAQRGISPSLAAYLQGNNLSQANTMASQQAMNTGANIDFQTQLANQQAVAQAHQMNQSGYLGAQGLQQGYNEGAANRAQATMGGILQGGGAALGLLSDQTLKEPVDDYHSHIMGMTEIKGAIDPSKYKSESNKEMELNEDDSHIHDFLNSLTPNMYRYKEGSAGDDGGKTHLGVMAQNLEKTEAGQGIVNQTEQGKSLDVAQLAGSLAAGLGAVHRRLLKLEGVE